MADSEQAPSNRPLQPGDTRPAPKTGESFLYLTLLLVFATTIAMVAANYIKPEPRGGLTPGQPMPAIQVEGWINGEPDLSNMKGKVVVVEAWATWCYPCRLEAPHLIEVYNQFKDRDDFVFIGVTQEDSSMLPAIEEYVAETKAPWPIGYGAGPMLNAFEAQYVPSVWIIGRDGKVVWNFDSPGEMSSAIQVALDQG